MAIAFRAASSNTSVTTSVVVNKPTGVVANDVLYAAVQSDGTIGAPPSGWTLLKTQANGSFTGKVFRKVTGASEPTTYTFTTSGGTPYINASIVAFSGANTSTVEDATTTSGSGTSATVTVPTITATTTSDMWIAVCQSFADGTYGAAPSGWTKAAGSDDANGTCVFYKQLTASGATGTEGFTPGGSAAFSAFSLLLLPAAVIANVTVTDSGTATETIVTGHILTDSGTASEIFAISATVPLSDSGVGTDTAIPTHGVTDSGTATETILITHPTTDSGTGSDTLSISATIPLTDSGTATEVIAVVKSIPPDRPPPPMPLISRGVPSFASSVNAYPASQANDGQYGTQWRSTDVPSSGTPQSLTYDLSGVASGSRGQILVMMYNEMGNLYLKPDSSDATSLFSDYKIQGNTAAGGGSPPGSGWVDLVTVTGNLYPTRAHSVNFTGYNWLRVSVTASLGTSPNNDVNFQMDVHDASNGIHDLWLFLGDSITLEGMLHPELGGGDWGYGGPVSEIVATKFGGVTNRCPAIIDGGNGGETQSWAATNMTGLLANFPGDIVVLAFGTNDANQNFQYTPGDSHVTTYYTDLLTCIDACIAKGYLVIVPYVPYGQNNGGDLGFNANLFNQYVDAHLPTDRPTVLRGPDFWTFFNNNPTLIRNDGGTQIHPTYTEVGGAASGYESMHMLYADFMYSAVYLQLTDSATATETFDISATVPLTDSGTDTEAFTIAATVPVTDSGTDSETINVNTGSAVSVSDSGTGSETVSITVSVPIADTGTAREVLAFNNTVPVADSGAGSEVFVTGHFVTDSGTASETFFTQPAAVVNDSGTGTEALIVGATVPLTDHGTGTETINIVVTVAISETATGVEILIATHFITIAESGVGTDTASVTAFAQSPIAAPYGTGGLSVGPHGTGALTKQDSIGSGKLTNLDGVGSSTLK